MFKWGIFAAVLLLNAVICGPDSYAITIGPDRLDVRLPPGEVAGADYYAQNDTDAPMHVEVEPQNWAKNSYDYTNLDIKDWISLDCYEFDLKPKEIKKLKLTVRVPKNVKGEIAAQIYFTSSGLQAEGSLTQNVRSRLSAILYVAIKGTEIVKGEINNISVSDTNDGKLKVEVAVKNDGNVHIWPSYGKVLIENEKGQRVALLDLATRHSVLPNSEYAYRAMLDKAKMNEGKYRISSEIKYGKMYGKEKTMRFEKQIEVDKEGKVLAK